MADAPPVPRPAATIVLLRRGGKHTERALEVLLVQRHLKASFMPGVWVFPGGIVEDSDGPGADDEVHRACAVRELEEEVGIALGEAAELIPYSRWITPEFVNVRFDTRFYLALAPAHAPPKPDGAEIVAARWIGPRQALEEHFAGDLALVFPTIKHLEALSEHASAEALLESARGRPIEPILPRVVGEGEQRRVVLPGEPGYA